MASLQTFEFLISRGDFGNTKPIRREHERILAKKAAMQCKIDFSYHLGVKERRINETGERSLQRTTFCRNNDAS